MKNRTRLLVKSFRLQLEGPLDPAAVDHLRRQIDRMNPDERSVLIDCARVTEIDPIGMVALWSLCRSSERGESLLGLTRLPGHLLRRLRSHPILQYVLNEDELFADPFGTVLASER
jgi:ABC-type transporter Mla MlaB component